MPVIVSTDIPADIGDKLPQELIDTILDFLHDDRTSLYASSLVVRHWLPTTRFHLFRRIIINHYVTNHGVKENVQRFLELVRLSGCTFLSFVKSILLCIDKEEILKDAIHTIESSSSNITQIIFADYRHAWEMGSSLTWIPPSFSQLRHLTYHIWTNLAEDTYRFVSSFPNLETLNLYTHVTCDATMIPKNIPSGTPGSSFAHLKTLRLSLCDSEHVLEWLQSFGWQPRLETFDLCMFRTHHNGWGPVKQLNSFIHANGETLRHLRLSIDHLSLKIKKDNELINLSPLSQLRTLHLRTHDMIAVSNMLTSLEGTSQMETVTVHATRWPFTEAIFGLCECLPSEMLGRLQAAMNGKQFSTLKTFEMCVPEEFGESGKEVIGHLLKNCRDRGILKAGLSPEENWQVDSLESVTRAR